MALTTISPARDPKDAVAMTDAPWQSRVRLAAFYRIFQQIGWTGLIFNPVALRVPGPERVFLINPFGLACEEVTASNLVFDSQVRQLDAVDSFYRERPAA